MGFWGKMTKPMRRVGTKVAKGFGIRKARHGKLRRDVQSCDSEDVQILWELLKRNEREVTRSATKTGKNSKKNGFLHCIDWSRCPPFVYHT
ncbi:hypothetical protein Leryth_012915 [Lithospermum erythrorhizon]|nr:hypothetical protein Leryth_012915 [Lithospermum erythrorhizon]